MADGQRKRAGSGGSLAIHRHLAIALLLLWLAEVPPGRAKEFDSSALLGGLAETAQREGLLIGQQALDDWRRIFEERSLDEWGKVWHVEKHRRCYSDLRDHMEWVCRSGLSLAKRNDGTTVGHRRFTDAGRHHGGGGGDRLLGVPTRRLSHLPLVFLYALRKVANAEQDDPPGSDLSQIAHGDTEDQISRDGLGPYGQSAIQALQVFKRSGAGRGKRKERGIMDECCHQPDGCSWEEYTEYCHIETRNRRFVPP